MLYSWQIRALAVGLVAIASVYLFVLCGLFTIDAPITNTVIAVVDAAIVLSALALVLTQAPRLVFIPLLGVALSFGLLAIFTQTLDVKSVRDVLIIVAFLALGIMIAHSGDGHLAFLIVSVGVFTFAVLELMFPDAYARVFNVLQFYIMRGELDPRVLEYTDNSLFISSMRNQGRFLLPFIGPHRVSSIFLEPVSMGNFGAIAMAWALSFPALQWRKALGVALVGAGAVIFADARFTPVSWMRLLIAAAPFVAVLMLLILGAFLGGPGDDLPTRLAQSGRTIANLDLDALLGLSADRQSTLDAGYAYVLRGFGLPFCLALWAAFVWLPAPSEHAMRFKFLVGLYICALLCVSGASLFALKTGALVWFLLGCAIGEGLASAQVPYALRTQSPATGLMKAPSP
jgi:putative polymerase